MSSNAGKGKVSGNGPGLSIARKESTAQLGER